MTMQYDLNQINKLTASDLEFIRQQGEDARRALSDTVTGLLSTPEGWRVCAEYRSEFGGFFPVQCRFSADGSDDWHLCVCSPGEVSPYWLLVLLSSGGEVVRTLYQSDTLQPDRISQLIAQLAGMRRFNCTARTVANLMSGECDSMIPSSHALVSLKPARQAAIQAISHVESARERGARLPAMPYVRTFLRLLTGSGRLNATVASKIPGLHWVPNNRHSNLKQVEEALNTMIATSGEACPLPLTIDVQAELFPEVMHTRTGRRLHRSGIKTTRQLRRQSREYEQHWKLRQNLLEQAKIDLNFQSPETVCTWYTRWSDEFDAAELAGPFWRWQSRFASLKELDWLRISGEPLYTVMYEIPFIVRETPEHVRVAERWQVPNKLADRSGV